MKGWQEMNKTCDIRLKVLISLVLIVATTMVYWQVKSFDFVGYDDETYITGNRHVQTGLTVKEFQWAFTTYYGGNWHPLTWLSHMLDCEIYGLNPMGHHSTNLLLHIANTLLLFFILQKMTGTLWRSAFVAALFALHPLHVESVAWVAGRKDVLSTFGGMLSLLAYQRYVKRPCFSNYFLIIFFLSLGLMAKSMLVTFPFLFLLLDFWPLKRFQWCTDRLREGEDESAPAGRDILRLIWEKVPLLVPVVISSVLTFRAEYIMGSVKSLETFSLKVRVTNALVSYVSYVYKTVWPQNLSVFYPHPGDTLPAWQPIGASFLIAGASFLAIRKLRQYPYIAVGLFWYLGTLVPVIGLIQVGKQAIADRYTYIPLIGLFIVIAWGTLDFFAKWRFPYKNILFFASAGVLLPTLMILTWMQVYHWKNAITLFEHAIKVTDNNYVAHNNLAIALSGRGKINEAIHHYEEVVRIRPNDTEALFNLGNAFYDHKGLDKAAFYYNKALEVDPAHAGAHNNLANLLFTQGKYGEAVAQYTEVLKESPDDIGARINLANVLFVIGRLDEAILLYNEVLKRNPKEADAHFNLGNLLLNKGETQSAMRHFAETINIDPEYAKAYHQIGEIFSREGKIEKARLFFSKAIQIESDHKQTRKHNNEY